ncbi:MAG: dipeptidase PepE [Gemmatimonadales bacterium]|jgi:dipeptidase E
MKRLLLLSNSTNYEMGYLEHARGLIKDYLGDGVKTVLFVPYAGVTISWDKFTEVVSGVYKELGYDMEPIHKAGDPVAAVEGAEAIAVGGGNTFHLLKTMYDNDVVGAIRERVLAGAPYMGWSAGSNVAGPTIRTTNDMPIVEPPTFDALELVPFQINPHYTDATLPRHKGETRADRLNEFIEANPGVAVAAIREGSVLRIEGDRVELLGDKDALVFIKGKDVTEHKPGDSLQFLMG